MKGLLEGVRVLDFTTMMAGPYCTRQLADLGAQIIKIESPTGEQNRRAAPIRDGESAVYGHLNCGKHSLSIDLKTAEGRRIALDLAAHCDVLVENARPGVMTRLGLDHAVVREVRPDIVYCSISGFGQTGPDAQNPAYAPVVQAASGYEMAMLEQQPEMTRPGFVGLFLADVMAAVQAFGASNAALFARERTGAGRYIDVSLMESVSWVLGYEIQLAQNHLDTPRGYYRPVRASDGFVMVAPGGQLTFESMARAMEHPEWIADPRCTTHPERNRNYADLMALVEDWTSTRSAAECERVLMEGKVPCARYREVQELFDDPQLDHRKAFATVSDGAGAFRVPTPPFSMTDAAVGARDWVAPFGSSAPQILGDLLGMQAEGIDDLFARGVLFSQGCAQSG